MGVFGVVIVECLIVILISCIMGLIPVIWAIKQTNRMLKRMKTEFENEDDWEDYEC